MAPTKPDNTHGDNDTNNNNGKDGPSQPEDAPSKPEPERNDQDNGKSKAGAVASAEDIAQEVNTTMNGSDQHSTLDSDTVEQLLSLDFYQLLGVDPSDHSQTQLKQAYKALSLKYHPDEGGTTAWFQRVNLAYSTLSNFAQRREYDATKDSVSMSGTWDRWHMV